jgi:hypothetical protein
MNEFQVIERSRAYARAMEHLNAAHAHIIQANGESARFDLGLDLPEKEIREAMHRCAHVYKQPPESPA